jgi:hypothetical protein
MIPLVARLTARLALVALVAAAAGCGSKKADCTGVLCGGACLDPASYQSDASNCGGCGIRCGAGASCSAGLCLCPQGTDRCDLLVPRCRDLQTDSGACGTCTTSCTTAKPGSTCQAATCQCGGAAPDDCGTFCTNTQTDPANCGTGTAGCGQVCPLTNEICSSGACLCPASLPDQCPDATPTACVNRSNDPANCNTCGNVCPLTNDVCIARACTCPTDLPDTCGDTCVNLGNDERNCGACGTICPSGATCTGAPAQCHCPRGAPDVCSATCVNNQTDEGNCGSCGNACATGATCSAGACQCPQGPTLGCGGTCCAGGTQCCGGNACETPHSNGLGGSYFDCNALYAPAQTTHAAALGAADSWNAGTTYDGTTSCGTYCIGRQTATQCAVWCYGLSPVAGRVALDGLDPTCLCPTLASPTWN